MMSHYTMLGQHVSCNFTVSSCLVMLNIVCFGVLFWVHPANAYLKGTDGEVEDYTIVTTILEEMNTTGEPEDVFPGMNFDKDEMCYLHYYVEAKGLETQGSFCQPDYDGILCWSPTLAGHNVSMHCPFYNNPALRAYRSCQNTGDWETVDYGECLSLQTIVIPTHPPELTVERALTYVYLVGCCLSLVLLTISLVIFCYFKSLQCTRIAIHKNLVVSFILRYICMIIVLQTVTEADIAVVDGNDVIRKQNIFKHATGLCRFILMVLEYCCMANIFWMFVEGMYLTSRISVAVFSRESNFKLYIFIGWVTPSFAVLTWAVLMRYHGNDLPCWEDYLESPYIWIVRAPMLAAIFVNSVFLINIIRILVTKLRASNTVETAQMRKAVKAVAVLFPLLGLTNLVFLWAPSERGVSENIYQISNAVLQSAQGIFVSVIYCFLNAEVRMTINRRLSNNMDVYGNNARARRTTQTHTNGSCVIATSSEVAMAVTFQKKLHPPSPPTDHKHEMKPFREELEDTYCEENEEQGVIIKLKSSPCSNGDNHSEDENTSPEKQRILSYSM